MADKASIPGLSITPETVLIHDDDATMLAGPFTIVLPNGLHSLPADGTGCVRLSMPDGRRVVVLHLSRHMLVLHQAFTPEGARALAQSLNLAADAAEAAMLEASNAQLAATLAKGKQA